MNRCLYCYKRVDEPNTDYHKECLKKFFGTSILPEIDFNDDKLEELALKIVQSKANITGVQSKLSLNIEFSKNNSKKLTIVGLWGQYILKPQSKYYDSLPENEDLTMHLAELSGIKTVPHSLIRMESGRLAYISRRIDRNKNKKIAMEDMCQLSEKLTEDKYNGSYEQVAKLISKFSSVSGLDLVNFAEILVFSYLTGNADMHLKNFSIIYDDKLKYILSPAYDLISTKLVVENDKEELALTLNGKKRKLNKNDFKESFIKFGLNETQLNNIFYKFESLSNEYIQFIDSGFLNEDYKAQYKKLISERADSLFN